MKQRGSLIGKGSAQVLGSTSMSVQKVDTIRPYLKSVVPIIKEALTDHVS